MFVLPPPSPRLLHAAPDEAELDQGEELSGPQQELFSGLSELYQTSTSEGNPKGKKRVYHTITVQPASSMASFLFYAVCMYVM